jgi:lysozyme
MTYSDDLRTFLKRWEGGPFLSPHWDAIGKVWDIGYGHVIKEDEERRDITRDEAEMLFDWDLHFFDDGVSALVSVPIAQCQFDALVALSYNIGLRAFGRSTLLGCVNDSNFDAAADEFMVWTRAQGKVVTGLVRRRAAERAMFCEADYSGRP